MLLRIFRWRDFARIGLRYQTFEVYYNETRAKPFFNLYHRYRLRSIIVYCPNAQRGAERAEFEEITNISPLNDVDFYKPRYSEETGKRTFIVEHLSQISIYI